MTSPAFMVMPSEAEQLIDQLAEQSVDEIGCQHRWLAYHHTIEKLNLQAHQSAQQKQDNFVIETLLTYQKFPTIISNLLACEIWKARVFPLLKCQDSDDASLRLYFILYHEAALVNLLEVAFYHEHVVETLNDDLVVEVIDYCVRKVTWLIALPRDAIATTTTFHKSGSEVIQMIQSQSTRLELARQQLEIEFRIAVQSVTLLRYIAERLHVLPLSIVSRLMDKHDILLSLVILIESPPWTHKALVTPPPLPPPTDGSASSTHRQQVQWRKFANQKWTVVEPSDLLELTPTEAQVWLAVYYLLCTQSAREHYEMTTYRKDQLLRIRKYLNELLVDQLPLLSDVQRYLDELAVVQLPPSSMAAGARGSLVMEALPQVRERIMQQLRGTRCQTIALRFDEESRSFSRGEDLKQLAEVYQMDGIEELLETSERQRVNTELDEEEAASKEASEEDEDLEPTLVHLVFTNFHAEESENMNKTGNTKQPSGRRTPLIVELGEEKQDVRADEPHEGGGTRNVSPMKQTRALLPDTVELTCDVELETCKAVETKTNRYYRYTLRPRQSIVRYVAWDASVQATVEFIGNNDDHTSITLAIDSLQLPKVPSTVPVTQSDCPRGTRRESFQKDKLWKQIGSLQEAHRVVVQCQFVTAVDAPPVGSRHDNQCESSHTAHDSNDNDQQLAPYELGVLFLSVPF